MRAVTKIVATKQSWIEGEAIAQLENSAKLEGMVKVIGMPDLHPGKGYPIGAVFISENLIYPYLIGGDIGCGMALYQTDILARKFKVDRMVKKLSNIEGPWDGDIQTWRDNFGVRTSEFDQSLGTIGSGNHFAEFLKIDQVEPQDTVDAIGLDPKYIFLLVHSGSRGYGESILRKVVSEHQNQPLVSDTKSFSEYLTNHADALIWAKANRGLIAQRFSDALKFKYRKVLEIEHNSLSSKSESGKQQWLHRKGAAPSDKGPVIIPGSRGAHSYLVLPTKETENSGWSLAHGAGRKWKRSEARGKLNENIESLSQTDIGSRVICAMYEEAPQAYKSIKNIIQDLKSHSLIETIARLAPVLTFKTQIVKK